MEAPVSRNDELIRGAILPMSLEALEQLSEIESRPPAAPLGGEMLLITRVSPPGDRIGKTSVLPSLTSRRLHRPRSSE